MEQNSTRRAAGPAPSSADHIALVWRDGSAQVSGAGQAQFGHAVPGSDPSDPQGIFARWHWDGSGFTAEVDRYGFFSLFYCESGGRLVVSPSLLRLVALGCDARPDKRALGLFHRLGMFIAGDTPFAAIKVLPPGGKLVWAQGKLTITAPPLSITPQAISRDQAVEGMIELFRASMTRALVSWEGPVYLPLSGGRDSRHILLEMNHLGRLPDACVTVHHGGVQLNDEALSARAICTAVGARHAVLGHRRPRLEDSYRALVLTQLCADEHAQFLPLHDYFLTRSGAAYDGIAGDILTNPDNDAERFFRHAEKGDFTAIAREMIAGHGRVISTPGWGKGAGPLYSPGQDEEAEHYLAETIASYADAPDPYQMFWFLHRTRREINFVPGGILSSADAAFAPYLDRDFVEFCISLPYAVTRDQQLHNDAIARAYPAFADVPFQEGFAKAAPPRGSMVHKLKSVPGVARIARFLAPDAPLATFRSFVETPGELNRASDEMYRLHALALDGMDADKARNMLDFAAKLEAGRPAHLVTDSFAPAPGQAAP